MGTLGKHWTLSDETKKRQSEAQKKVKRRKHTEEEKENMRKIAKERGYGKWMKGKKLTKEHKDNISKGVNKPEVINKIAEASLGREPWNKGTKGVMIAWNKGVPMSEKTKEKISISRIGKYMGEEHWKWIKNRNELKRAEASEERRSPAYKYWRKQVYERDGHKCKINNNDCSGRIEAHHILGFAQYPELRYEVNNGITLCHFHHPKKRKEEEELVSFFINLLKLDRS